jgi:hypothetical protein
MDIPSCKSEIPQMTVNFCNLCNIKCEGSLCISCKRLDIPIISKTTNVIQINRENNEYKEIRKNNEYRENRPFSVSKGTPDFTLNQFN